MKGRKPDYPILLTLNGEEKSKSQNEELKREGEFLVKQIHNERSFVAYIEPEGEPVETPFYMSQLNAQPGGICDKHTIFR